jgi:hypothetical protein
MESTPSTAAAGSFVLPGSILAKGDFVHLTYNKTPHSDAVQRPCQLYSVSDSVSHTASVLAPDVHRTAPVSVI